jgi:hypothetical protein
VAGSLIGLLALIAVAIPQWVLPAVLPAAPAPHSAMDAGHSLGERIMAKLKGTALKKDSAPKMQEAESAQEEWRRVLLAAAVSLGLLAIVLAVFSLIRREEKLYAGVAAALGIGAIALQAAILVAGAAATILILYLVLKQSDGGFQFAGIGIGAIVVFAVIAILGAGLVSPQLAALIAVAVTLILIVLSFLGAA